MPSSVPFFLVGAAILLACFAVVAWRFLQRPMSEEEMRRRIKALAERAPERSDAPEMDMPVASSRVWPARSGWTGVAGLAVALFVGFLWLMLPSLPPTDPAEEPGIEPLAGRAVEAAIAGPYDLRHEDLRPASAVGELEHPSPEAAAPVGATSARMSVIRSGVGTDVVERELVGRSDTFDVGTAMAFWTHVAGGRPGDVIHHVWLHEGRVEGVVELPVEGPSWRTESRRSLDETAEGDWVVEARDVRGRVIARHEFTVLSPSAGQ